VVTALVRGIRWGLDRMLAVGYGVVYDSLFERFGPYQALKAEVLQLVKEAGAGAASPADVRVLEIGCGPGTFALTLAEAGFSVVGIDTYGALVELAREKRRARQLANLAFQRAEMVRPLAFPDGAFDQVVNIHSLYCHPDPGGLLREAWRILRPGGHAVFVNRARRLSPAAAFREVCASDGARAALGALLWSAANAVFEAARKPVGPYYWQAEEFAARLGEAGFAVLALRPTFFVQTSLLAWVRKPPAPPAGEGTP